jgi:CubicO group peptidase (beta-lactamase class C family)
MRLPIFLTLLLTSALTAADPIPQRMQEFVDAGTIAGAVTLVQHQGKVVSHHAVGFQDLGTRKPMQTDTLFQIMSMTKPVTCTGILILMEEGRLSLMDPVSRHLPEFRYQKLRQGARGDGSVTLTEPSREITIRDLMTHTSGLPPSPGPAAANLYRTFDKTLAEVVAMAAGNPLNFEPGTRWQYSNMGLATLGRIIEVTSGQQYHDFIRARIFDPLGMKDSFFYLPEDRRPRLASNYTLTAGKLEKTTADIYRKGSKYPMPEGGMYSTAADMAAFYQMLLDGGRDILSPASVELMTKNHTGDLKAGFQPGIGFGLGVFVVRETEGEFRLQSIGSFGHGGAYRTYNWADPSKDLIGIFMTQRTNVGGDLAEEISAFVQMAGSQASK